MSGPVENPLPARIPAIDLLRGLSICLMVFFTMNHRLSHDLPSYLQHNVPGTLRGGDFVLPLFLFTSGLSLGLRPRGMPCPLNYGKICKRLGMLFIVAAALSPWTAGALLGMDEIMLNALLFIPSLLLATAGETVLLSVCLLTFTLYLLLAATAHSPDYAKSYLGGYRAAIFYLPVMLAGIVTVRRTSALRMLFLFSLLLFVLLDLLVPPEKTAVTPSFMVLAIMVCIAAYGIVQRGRCEPLEYIGRHPLRAWLILFLCLAIPLTTRLLRPYDVRSDWIVGDFLAFLCIPLVYLISRGIDRFSCLIRPIGRVRNAV